MLRSASIGKRLLLLNNKSSQAKIDCKIEKVKKRDVVTFGSDIVNVDDQASTIQDLRGPSVERVAARKLPFERQI